MLVVETGTPAGVERALMAAALAVETLRGPDALEDAVARAGGSRQPAAVVIDGMVPGDVLARLKQRARGHLPVLVVGALDSAGRAGALRAGADDCMGNLIESELLARVEAHLRTARAFVKATSPVMPAAERAGERRYGLRRLQEEFLRAERYKEPLSLLVVAAAAQISTSARAGMLAELAVELERVIRAQDLLLREAEEDLLVLLPNTHFVGALTLGERVLKDLRGREIALPTGGIARPELWIGAACFPGRELVTSDDLLRMARAALARARREDAGRVCIYQYQGYIYQPT